MTTNFRTITLLDFQTIIVIMFPSKTVVFLDNFPACPNAHPPLQNASFYFYCHLAISDSHRILVQSRPHEKFISRPFLGFWAELKGGRGKTFRKAKPREDGPLETIFGDPPKTVSEVFT